MGNKKLYYDDIKDRIESFGYILISTEYINNSSKLIVKDSDGYYYLVTYGNLFKHVPPKVHKSNPYSIQNIKLWTELNKKTFKLVDNQEFIGASKNLKWKCFKCTEVFKATWSNISHVSKNYGCSYCAGKKAGTSNCLATLNPTLASEWHPTLNGDLTPYNITLGSGKDVWWKCSKNVKHEWKSTISNRNNKGDGCPYCSGHRTSEDYNLLVINPELCKDWDYVKNDKRPEDYTPGSGEYIWWQCNKGHNWLAVISSRNSGCGCPYCAGQLPTEENNLLVINPKLCEEWNYVKNDKRPEEYCPNANQEVWWKCKENPKHEWNALISNRNSKESGCPYCAGQLPSEDNNLFTRNSELASEWHPTLNGDLTPYDVTVSSNTYAWWKCKECGLEWNTMIGWRSGDKATNCPECSRTSTGEILISDVLNTYNISNTSQFRIKECRDKRVLPFDHAVFRDIKKTNLILLIEFDGYHHFFPVCFGGISKEQALDNLKKKKIHDKMKDQYCLENNIPLLRIHYKDFKNIPSILTIELQKYDLLKMKDIYIDKDLPNIILDNAPLTSPDNIHIL